MNFVTTAEEKFSQAAEKIARIEVNGVRLFNSFSPTQLAEYTAFWLKNEFLMVPKALTDEAIAMFSREITFENMTSVNDPRQFFRVHNDEACHPFIHHQVLHACTQFYEGVLSTTLIPAYAFAMKYIKNSDMDPHYDNFNNPISSTVCYHFTPGGLSNPVYVDRAKFSNPYTMRLTVKDRPGIPAENVATLDLHPGDIAIFRGRNHLHWRDAVANDMDYRALLLHFCDYNYKGVSSAGGQIPNVAHELIDIESYDEFRETYTMYFEKNGQDWT